MRRQCGHCKEHKLLRVHILLLRVHILLLRRLPWGLLLLCRAHGATTRALHGLQMSTHMTVHDTLNNVERQERAVRDKANL
jgi:hypothetical protein